MAGFGTGPKRGCGRLEFQINVSAAQLCAPRPGIRQKSPSLRANAAWTLWGNSVSATCQWGMMIALAKIGTPDLVGQYALALAISAPVMLFSNLQLRAVQATDVGDEYHFGDYLSVRLWTTAAASLVMLGAALWGGYQLSTILAILGITLWKGVDGISDVFYGFLQRHERMDTIARSMLVRGPLSLAVLAAGVQATARMWPGVLGATLVSAAVLLLYDLPASRRVLRISVRPSQAGPPASFFTPEWRPMYIRKLIWSAIPLGTVAMCISLQINMPRYFIEHHFGEAEVGIFSALAYVLWAGDLVVNALGQALTPRLAKLYHSGAVGKFRALMLKLLIIAAVGGCAGVLAGSVFARQVLDFLYRPEYARNLDVFRILLVSAAPAYLATFLSYGLTAARMFWVQLPLSALSMLTIAGLCLWLVPTGGLRGAADAVLVTSTVRVAAFGLILLRVRKGGLGICPTGNGFE
jgi:O-antigen/teichoic acid export membrane protein